jgi:excisionase family DNA binding protein
MNKKDELRQWNSKKEVAKYLRLSLRTLERRIEAGLLEARKDGRLVRIHRRWVLDYESDF